MFIVLSVLKRLLRSRLVLISVLVLCLGLGGWVIHARFIAPEQKAAAMAVHLKAIEQDNKTIRKNLKTLSTIPELKSGKFRVSELRKSVDAVDKSLQAAFKKAQEALGALKDAYTSCTTHLGKYIANGLGLGRSRVEARNLPWTDQVTCERIPAELASLVGIKL